MSETTNEREERVLLFLGLKLDNRRRPHFAYLDVTEQYEAEGLEMIIAEAPPPIRADGPESRSRAVILFGTMDHLVLTFSKRLGHTTSDRPGVLRRFETTRNEDSGLTVFYSGAVESWVGILSDQELVRALQVRHEAEERALRQHKKNKADATRNEWAQGLQFVRDAYLAASGPAQAEMIGVVVRYITTGRIK